VGYVEVALGVVALVVAYLSVSVWRVQPRAMKYIDEVFDSPGSPHFRERQGLDPHPSGRFAGRLKLTIILTLMGVGLVIGGATHIS
jgi:hypothetical protein